jgi:hypothetical protein
VSVLRLDGSDPVANPFAFLHEKLFVLEPFAFAIVHNPFATLPAKEICDLVFEDADEPCPLRAAPGESFVSLKRSDECLLHDIFCLRLIAQTEGCVPVKVVSMQINPNRRVGRGLCRGWLLFAHRKSAARSCFHGSN